MSQSRASISFRGFQAKDAGALPTARRRQSTRAAVASALQLVEPAPARAALLAIPRYEVNAVEFERRFNLTPATAQTLYKAADAVLLGTPTPLASSSRSRHFNGDWRKVHRDYHLIVGTAAPYRRR